MFSKLNGKLQNLSIHHKTGPKKREKIRVVEVALALAQYSAITLSQSKS
jgi:hypothetical protein